MPKSVEADDQEALTVARQNALAKPVARAVSWTAVAAAAIALAAGAVRNARR